MNLSLMGDYIATILINIKMNVQLPNVYLKNTLVSHNMQKFPEFING